MCCRSVGVTGGFRLNCSKYAIGDAEQQLGVGAKTLERKKVSESCWREASSSSTDNPE